MASKIPFILTIRDRHTWCIRVYGAAALLGGQPAFLAKDGTYVPFEGKGTRKGKMRVFKKRFEAEAVIEELHKDTVEKERLLAALNMPKENFPDKTRNEKA